MSQELDIPDSWIDSETGELVTGSIAAITNLIPAVGAVIGSVASGRLLDRKIRRLADTVDSLRCELGDLRVEIDEEYVSSEDFEDLMEEALQKAVRERSQAKRQAYARFLANDLRRPAAQPYDAKRTLLKKLEALEDDHLRLLAAIVREPRVIDSLGIAGGRGFVLAGRMGEDIKQVEALFEGLQQEDLAHRAASLMGMVSEREAEHTSQLLTKLGHALVGYLASVDSGSPGADCEGC